MVSGHRVRHAGGHVLVRPPIRGQQRDAVRGVLPVSGPAGAQLPAAGGPGSVPGLLRGAVIRDRVLLRHDGPTPDQQHQEHARRSPGEFGLLLPTHTTVNETALFSSRYSSGNAKRRSVVVWCSGLRINLRESVPNYV